MSRTVTRAQLPSVSQLDARSFPLPGARGSQDEPPRASRASGVPVVPAGFSDEHLWLSVRLLAQVRRFGVLTVITPSGALGRHEWRQLARLIRAEPEGRKIVLDLLFTRHVHNAVLVTVLAASRQRRYRGMPFVLWNLPGALPCAGLGS